jgi:hypothetical protein
MKIPGVEIHTYGKGSLLKLPLGLLEFGGGGSKKSSHYSG